MKGAPNLSELRSKGIDKSESPKRQTRGDHHFRFTEKQAIDSGLYEIVGSRSLKDISNWLLSLVKAVRDNKAKITLT